MQFFATMVENFTAFFWLYSMSWSLLIGISYMVSIHHGWLWFPERPGLISGLVIGGFGLGALIFDNVSTYLINPMNLG